MKWPTAQLKKAAPNASSKIKFKPFDEVWHLNLDQIESHTGEIINKKMAPASSAGNSTYTFDDKNVLYSKLRPYLNKVVCPDEPGIATTELVPLCPHPKFLDRKFFTYYLRSHQFVNFASAMVAGAKMPRIIMAKFWDYKIPLPPLSEQRQIVKILDQADRLRKLRAEADKKAERILPSLFIKMFGDPVTNPKGWETKSLIQVCIDKPQYGANASAAEWSEGKPRYVRITDIQNNGQLSQNNIVTLNLDNWGPYQLEEGDLLFARSGNTVGKTYLYQPDDGLCAYAGYLVRFKPDFEQVDPVYLFAFTQTDYYKSWVEARKRVAGQPNINGKEYSAFSILAPPLPLQQKFSDLLKNLYSVRKNTDNSFIQQEVLFNNILHRAFTGGLTASWRQAHMNELLQEMEIQAKTLAL